MKPEDFINSKDKQKFILNHLNNDDRLLRLFAVACNYKIWDLLEHEDSKNAIKIAELYADGLATDQQLTKARNKAWNVYYNSAYVGYAAAAAANATATNAANAAANAATDAAFAANAAAYTREEMRLQQSIILQNMQGKWQNHYNTSTVNSIAQNIYDNKSYDLFPIFADALQDAGCNDEEMLEYCRNSGSFFFRGCWVLDKAMRKR